MANDWGFMSSIYKVLKHKGNRYKFIYSITLIEYSDTDKEKLIKEGVFACS